MTGTKKIFDLTGKRFGGLTVLRFLERRGKDTLWICKCGCGKETVADSAHLKKGQKKSCGCLPRGPKKTRAMLDFQGDGILDRDFD